MKKIALASLAMALLAGCGSPQIDWQQDNLAVVSNITIGLKSTLWMNQMPAISDEETPAAPALHGILRLDSSAVLPANLTVDALVIQQGSRSWIVDSDSLELRTYSENQWEVVFERKIEANTDEAVDIALQLSDGEKAQWLVDRGVMIDNVY
ncbi:hypothetical protein [Vibrio sp. S12_S33]|uniref:hypothetical protein n=1 Tax=Vibrio sp. S12_S33 TaxID=2720223 RepID=UPI00177BEBC8|nr:hypothetical protein [Vibrio sp. S12_S33]MBD1566303.1 hypothetical protein [Vibrio sp. S12_S33]